VAEQLLHTVSWKWTGCEISHGNGQRSYSLSSYLLLPDVWLLPE
jgi:hypothetical protein